MTKIITVNAISGGKSSGYIGVHYPADYNVFSLVCIDDIECSPPDKQIIKYVNDKLGERYIKKYGEFIATAEDDQTLYAMRDLEQLMGREIKWIRGESFDTILETKSIHGGIPTMLPNKMFRYCTDRMKMQTMFEWWLINIGEKVEMRIGFRFDEFGRIENFLNSGNATIYKIPVSQRTYGAKLQQHVTYNWRNIKLPLAKNGIISENVKEFFKGKIDFPEISNCFMCFWKSPEEQCIMALRNPAKARWAMKKELIGKGTWIKGVSYEKLVQHANDNKEVFTEVLTTTNSCDSGGCTD